MRYRSSRTYSTIADAFSMLLKVFKVQICLHIPNRQHSYSIQFMGILNLLHFSMFTSSSKTVIVTQIYLKLYFVSNYLISSIDHFQINEYLPTDFKKPFNVIFYNLINLFGKLHCYLLRTM